ncbi:MAG: adenylate kinase [Christensenellaceae bacterium]|nr:adenylate kinase [Christensenellaceae bacterium]
MNIILLGPPGSGKGTMAGLIQKKYSIPQISTGDMLRSNIKEGTELGKKAKAFVNAGELVPDSLVIAMVKERLSEPDCENGYILDGFPRTIAQAEALDSIAKIEAVIDLILDDEKSIARMSGRRVCPSCSATYHVSVIGDEKLCSKCGTELVIRKDDEESTIRNRLKIYHEMTSPLEEYYRKKGLLVSIDVDGSIEENFAKILSALGVYS